MNRMVRHQFRHQYWFVGLVFIAVALLSRFLPHPPNLTALGALALFAPAVFKTRRYPLLTSVALPLAILLISDLVLGFYSGLAFTYGAFAIVAILAHGLRPEQSFGRAALSAPLASLIFFGVSNLGVWLASGLYAKTWAGLVECYVMALPFVGNQLAGDVLFTAAFAITFKVVLGEKAAAEAGSLAQIRSR